ncbi:hypothetical protein CNR37_00040 [Pseudomonas phage ventosus]|uniref:DUF7390 domain-containing protein n=1 Tax=Pseudomonas phage ventosus TaxID=2048980 RepID=A0A2H4P7U5_9CAUD|nr:hypothetical protein CNR37_00040 [Pseudomonas phage ventosus]
MEFEVKDTSQIQVDSLIAFMASLGYTYKEKGWVTDSEALKHISRVSHRTAIALHNLPIYLWKLQPNNMYAPLINGKLFDIAMNGYALSRSQATKLVKKVKFQPSRKEQEGIMLQNHMIKPYQSYMTVTLGLE